MILPNAPGKNGKYHNTTGQYYIQHPEKYKGTSQPIFKSRLERLMMSYLDNNKAVVSWSYEPRAIKYRDMTTLDKYGQGKVRNYYIDFVATIIGEGNKLKTVWIEVKSDRETHPPRNKNNKLEMQTWIKNQSKWSAAKQLCEAMGVEFLVITEKQLT